MHKFLYLLGAAFLVAILSLFAAESLFAANKKEVSSQPVYERVMKDRTLRCGYFNYAPYVMRDPNTGKLSGSFYDLTEKLAQVMNLKVEWTQETTFSTYIEDMRTGRYDVMCGGFWPIGNMADMAYTDPVFFVPYYVYVRADDHRFDKNVALLNNPQYKFATIDGETSSIVKSEDFPNAKSVSLPNVSDVSQILLEVSSKRADATTAEPIVADLFLKNNSGTLRAIHTKEPVRVFETVWTVSAGEQKLANWLNNGVRQMLFSGFVEPIVEKYHGKGTFLPVAKPYR